MLIASDIGRVMKCNSKDMEALEWGGLLHDIGKIGVRDEVLLKQDKLNRDERTLMNAHPVLGADIVSPVRRLAPELPIIRHHHEWYNGSGYPDRLLGDEIPRLARILHVADAFEAMTAARPYRKTPLTNEQAMSELRKFAGIQFDPVVVDAFSKTPWAEGVPDPGGEPTRRVIPLLSGEGARIAQASAAAGPRDLDRHRDADGQGAESSLDGDQGGLTGACHRDRRRPSRRLRARWQRRQPPLQHPAPPLARAARPRRDRPVRHRDRTQRRRPGGRGDPPAALRVRVRAAPRRLLGEPARAPASG